MGVVEKLKSVPSLIRLEQTLFALPFTYIGMLFAGPTITQFLLITIALVSARGAAFSINRYIGRNLDSGNPKKKNWSSIILYSKKEILLVFLSFSIIFMLSAFELNVLALVLAPLILLIVALEPYTKIYTQHRHFSMGVVIGLGIFGGYIGVAGHFPTTLPLYLLLAGYALFAGSNDIIYTLHHVDYDKKNNIKTYPVYYGVANSINYSISAHNLSVIAFALFGLASGAPIIVFASLVVYLIFVLEHRALDARSGRSIQISFFNYNIIISMVMLVSVLIFLFAH